jgi:hypothetical protein
LETDEKELALKNEEDTDLNTPVDPQAYESIKVARNKFKKKNMEWIANFKRAHLRDPTKTDMEVIKDQIDEFNFYNKKYILLKAKMIRQGLIQPKFDIQEPEASTTDKGAALQRRMTMTGMKFNAGGGGNFTSSKGFGALANAINGTETFFADPSLKKLKEDISMKEV